MYIKNLSVENFKSFKGFSDLKFLHPKIKEIQLKQDFDVAEVRYDNINVVLGNNSTGKTGVATFARTLS